MIDTAIIMSAGLGTRMGDIGKILPKPLWPLYEKSLLEIQIRYLKKKGISKIYINTHHHHDQIEKLLTDLNIENVEILYEKELLDSGGAIHNLYSKDPVDYLLYVAGDQFYFFDDSLWTVALEKIDRYEAVLFSMRATKGSGYKRLVEDDGFISGIDKNEDQYPDEYKTFSGVGLLNLKDLEVINGPSKFFETVIQFENKKIIDLYPLDQEYWDFGTSEIYFKNCFDLLNGGKLMDFLIDQAFLDTKYLNKNDLSYRSDQKNVLNFGGGSLGGDAMKSIILDNKNHLFQGPGLYYREIFQPVSS